VKTILLTTDLSDTSKRAIEPALALARNFGARLVLAHVGELPPDSTFQRQDLALEDAVDRQRERARQGLSRFAAENLPEGVQADLVVALGVPHTEIVRLARELDADLIAMATHGRGFISHAMLGSTTEKVLRRTDCPVLVVRDPGSKRPHRLAAG
jgi:nucleotide-binding universal stress UspA family protein